MSKVKAVRPSLQLHPYYLTSECDLRVTTTKDFKAELQDQDAALLDCLCASLLDTRWTSMVDVLVEGRS